MTEVLFLSIYIYMENKSHTYEMSDTIWENI